MKLTQLFLTLTLVTSFNNSIFGMNSSIQKKQHYCKEKSERLFKALEIRPINLNAIEELLKEDKNGLCADPNIQDGYGSTALHYAALKNDTKLITLLLTYNANPNIKDNDQWTSFAKAASFGKFLEYHYLDEVNFILNYIRKIESMNSAKRLEYLCENHNLRKQILNFLSCLKERQKITGIKIPKPLIKDILLRAWELEHPDDYRCQIWNANDETKRELLKDWMQLPDNIIYHNLYGIELIEKFKTEYKLNALVPHRLFCDFLL